MDDPRIGNIIKTDDGVQSGDIAIVFHPCDEGL